MAVTQTYSLVHYVDIALTRGPSDGPADIVGSYGTEGYAAASNHSTVGGHTDVDLFDGSSINFGGKTNIGFTSPAIDRLNNGNFIIAGQDADSIRYTILSPTGTTVTVETDTNDTGTSNADVSEASTLDGYWIAYQDLVSGTNTDIEIRRYASTGALQANFVVDSTAAIDSAPSIDELRNGNLAVAWTRTIGTETELWRAVYNDAGGVIKAPEVSDTVGTTNKNVSLAATPDTGFAIVYEDNGWGTGTDITLQTFTAAGAVTGTYNISNPAIGTDVLIDLAPDIDVMLDGKLAVSWTSVDLLNNRTTEVALFDPASGTVLANYVVANAGTDPVNAAIATYGQGNIAVVHTDAGTNKGEVLLERLTSIGDAGDNLIDGARSAYNDMSGREGDDVMVGGNNEDLIKGEAGNDTLSGGNGIDGLYGGDDNDSLSGGSGINILDGGTGIDTADYSGATASVSVDLSVVGQQHTQFSTDTLIGIENLTGSDFDDELTGNTGANTLDGRGGGDAMAGGIGNDIYYVDDAGDAATELGGQGTDSVRTTLAVYTLAANVERLYNDNTTAYTAIGNASNNTIYGNNGDDRFRDYNLGVDKFSGGNGSDAMYYTGAAAAVLNFATGVHGGSALGDAFASVENFFGSNTGGDTMTGGAGRAIFNGQGGNDALNGGANHDKLYGGAGLDTLSGGGGNDQLYGGAGNDTMTGGALRDDFIYTETAASGGWGTDTITDFQDGVDFLKFANPVADAFADFSITGNGTSSVTLKLAAAPANTIILNGAAPITLTAADFLFF